MHPWTERQENVEKRLKHLETWACQHRDAAPGEGVPTFSTPDWSDIEHKRLCDFCAEDHITTRPGESVVDAVMRALTDFKELNKMHGRVVAENQHLRSGANGADDLIDQIETSIDIWKGLDERQAPA